ncbi:MAG: hypothetical protein NTW50_01010 [Candidatus Berkelbacteria bacterium]|nr:hypothetical protein [Candidatus Berkelbacteria bacterium]
MLDLFFDPKFPIQEVKDCIEKSVKLNSKFFKFSNQIIPKFEIELVYSREEFSSKLNRETASWESGYCSNNHFIIFHPDFFESETTHRREDFGKTLTHEIAHIFIESINSKFLWWVSEGVAQYVAKQANYTGTNNLDNCIR